MDSAAGKKEMEEKKEWVKAISTSAETRKRSWPIIVHGIKVADHQLDAWEKQAKRIVQENAKLHPSLQIRGLRWLSRIDGKEFSTLIIEADSAEHANRMICEGVITGYDFKVAERYDTKCRITQYFKCYKYGHISSICLNAQKCGFCGEGHSTDACADKTQATLKKCAGCNGGNHTAWSRDCPARVKELQRVKAAQLSLPKLFPVATAERFFTGSTRAGNTRLSGASQVESTRPPGASQVNGDAPDASKKRKLNPIGRPTGAVSKAKTIDRGAGANSILNFTTSSQAQPAPSKQNAGETPASNIPADDPTINGNMSDICES
jgi:hypothetical protein